MAGLPKRLLAKRAAQNDLIDLRRAVETLVRAVNGHDTYTGGHSCRVSSFATAIARVLELPPSETELIRQAGLVHDVGKIGIPDKILRKTDPLTPQELHLIRLHPIVGASIMSRIPHMEKLIPIVLHHHERWDGNGYPQEIKGIDIPMGARIVFVADAFDAMTSERPYASSLSSEDALKELKKNAGSQFDAVLVEAIDTAWRSGVLDHDSRDRSARGTLRPASA